MSKDDNRLILLGTKGGPRIAKGTAWPTSNLLVVEGKPYLIDAGLGVTRQVCEAGFMPFDLDRIFITHNHSDHNLELGGLLHTGWMSGPLREIEIYGAPGVDNLMKGFFQSQSFDISIRVEDEGVVPLKPDEAHVAAGRAAVSAARTALGGGNAKRGPSLVDFLW